MRGEWEIQRDGVGNGHGHGDSDGDGDGDGIGEDVEWPMEGIAGNLSW